MFDKCKQNKCMGWVWATTWARAVQEDFPEEAPEEPVLRVGPHFVGRAKASTLPRRLSVSKHQTEAGKAAKLSANAVSLGLISEELGLRRLVGLTAGPAEKADWEQACCCHSGRAVGAAQEGLGERGYLLWGEEEAVSGPLSSINSRMESGWSRWLRSQPCFLNTHGWPRPFNPGTPQGSCRKKTVAFGPETPQLGCSLGHFFAAQKQTEIRIL